MKPYKSAATKYKSGATKRKSKDAAEQKHKDIIKKMPRISSYWSDSLQQSTNAGNYNYYFYYVLSKKMLIFIKFNIRFGLVLLIFQQIVLKAPYE